MEYNNVRPNATTLVTLMNAYANAGDPAGTERTLQRMQENGLRPNLTALNTLMKAYARAGNAQGAERTLEVMHDLSMSPNETTYKTLMTAYLDAEDLRGAEDLLERVKSEDCPLEPHVVHALEDRVRWKHSCSELIERLHPTEESAGFWTRFADFWKRLGQSIRNALRGGDGDSGG